MGPHAAAARWHTRIVHMHVPLLRVASACRMNVARQAQKREAGAKVLNYWMNGRVRTAFNAIRWATPALTTALPSASPRSTPK